jgi:hypothetical protein
MVSEGGQLKPILTGSALELSIIFIVSAAPQFIKRSIFRRKPCLFHLDLSCLRSIPATHSARFSAF